MIEINEKIARRVLDVVDAGLIHGMGVPEPGKMCVEAAVNYALGQPHSDEPACVAPSLRRLKIKLNDSRWSSVKARTAGLRRLALAQLGSAGAAAAAAYAAYAAADAADAADVADVADVRDKSLAAFAEGVVQILIDMGAPGCQWLWLTEAA